MFSEKTAIQISNQVRPVRYHCFQRWQLYKYQIRWGLLGMKPLPFPKYKKISSRRLWKHLEKNMEILFKWEFNYFSFCHKVFKMLSVVILMPKHRKVTMNFLLLKRVENIVAKEEIALFLLLSQCFQNLSAAEASESVCMWYKFP